MPCITLKTQNYVNGGTFLILGYAGFISTVVRPSAPREDRVLLPGNGPGHRHSQGLGFRVQSGIEIHATAVLAVMLYLGLIGPCTVHHVLQRITAHLAKLGPGCIHAHDWEEEIQAVGRLMI